ncbi:SDR family NAD(P)-dependent oxidoreductase [Brevundimonas vesicularis]|uniref:SDR family NAD(P)-dependent oxidoreductase n=1 Tax=Brevundimonas vesicularis TaxID=41276 RepID=UPI0038D4D6E4
MSRSGFTDRVAIVTGAARGMGEAVARRLVGEGARVCLVDRDVQAVQAVAGSLGASAFAVEADVTSPEQIEAFVDATVSRWGRIDMLHNNAGVTGASGPAVNSTLDDLDFVFAVNFRAAFVAIKAAVPHMADGGAIVNMSSLFGIRAAPGMGLYGASKAAVIGLTRTLAVELAPRNIRVNSVAPGAIETDLLRSSNAALHVPGGPSYDEKLRSMPMGRAGTPQEAANLIVWLLGPESTFVSGSVYQIDGARGA